MSAGEPFGWDTMAAVFERFTDEARHVVVMASEEAREIPHNYIGTEHLLLGLLRVDDSIGFWALNDTGISLDSARRAVRLLVGAGEEPQGHVPFTPRAKNVLEHALRVSMQRDSETIGSGDLLLGLLREPDSVAVRVLRELDVDLAVLERQTRAAMNERVEMRRDEPEPVRAVEATDGQLLEISIRLDNIEAKLDEVLRRLPGPG
jgi:ATP-dependent Clp protease ATP-binding subunit ClpC